VALLRLGPFVRPIIGSPAVYTTTLLACYAMTGVIHLATIVLNTLLPFHVVDLGGSRAQVGLLFSVTTVVSMVLRPLVGDLVDRVGARPVIGPGIVALGLTSLVLHLAGTPETVIALMVGVGLANGLVSSGASTLAARSSAAAHRGEALGTYYLASALALALGPPVAFGLRALGGMSLVFATVTIMAAVMAGLLRRMPAGTGGLLAAGPLGLRLFSRSALATSFALVLSTIGYSAVTAFLPLYAVSRGQGTGLAWFFAIYPIWLIAGRVMLRGTGDRLGRGRVALVSMVLTGVAYLVLAVPPTSVTLVIAAVVLASGNAVLYPTLAALVVDGAPEPERGLALGTLSAAWDLGIVVGASLIGAVADRASFRAAFTVAAISTTLGVIALAGSLRSGGASAGSFTSGGAAAAPPDAPPPADPGPEGAGEAGTRTR
jgi:MFS family permease